MQKELSDFLKVAYEHGRVKDLKDAFEEYPVDEEWHKGKLENVLNEDDKSYNHYEIGDIVFVKEYSYSDGKIENFGMLVSSNLNKLKFKANKLLEKDEMNNLYKDSLVKTDFVYKISNEQIIFKVGIVSYEKIEEYKKVFIII